MLPVRTVETSGQNCLFCALITLISTMWSVAILWRYFHKGESQNAAHFHTFGLPKLQKMIGGWLDDGAIKDDSNVYGA